MTDPRPLPAIAIHGGAGTIERRLLTPEQETLYHAGLAGAVRAGQLVLEQGGSALDAVTEAVVALEDYPLFNAGHGAVYTRDGKHELDASIMDGRTLATGAVGCVRRLRNPIRAARTASRPATQIIGGTRCSAVLGDPNACNSSISDLG